MNTNGSTAIRPAAPDPSSTPEDLTPLERRLLNEFQHHLPLSPTPFAEMAERLGCSESQILQLLEDLQQRGFISRVGPVFRPCGIGASMLVATTVPEDELEKIANFISSYDEVNHNYERQHRLNLWFVVTAPDQGHLDRVLEDMEHFTGLDLVRLPLVREYHIDLGFPLWC